MLRNLRQVVLEITKMKTYKYLRRVIMSIFIECVLEKLWPSFINKKDKYKWIGVHSMSNPNPNHKRFTILKNNEPRQSNNNK